MSWALDLRGAFVRIYYRIDTRSGERAERFEGVGYYKMAEPDRFTGSWLDSQGAIHPLESSVEGQTLTTFWGVRGNGTFGRTTYQILEDGRVEVVDAVLGEGDAWREFSRNTLVKADD
jgi:hypothetical protein